MARRVDVIKTNSDTLPLILTPREAAQLARIGTEQVYARLRSGEIPSKRFNRQWRIPKNSFLRWLEQVQ